MRHTFYNRFIKPLSKNSDQAEREIVLNYLLVGIFALAVITLVDTLLAPVISGESFYPLRLLAMTINIAIIAGLYFVARYKQLHKAVAITLTLLIITSGYFVASQWGVLNTNSVLLFSLAVVMAGVLIGARYSLYATCFIAVVLAYLQNGEAAGRLHPDLSWLTTKPTAGDVVGFSAILFVIAWVSWLFNRQMELSLKRAQRSEKALQRQRDSLEAKVEKRARQLEAAQLEKMQQLYRFAELGQLSTALFHDLADHLSTVNLDIEGLATGERPDIMRRIQENVGEINAIVRRVRRQIGGRSDVEVFDVVGEVKEVIKILAPAAERAEVAVSINIDRSIEPSLSCRGDITRFRQVILNIISNGIEAYPAPGASAAGRSVTVGLTRQSSTLLISVTDHGRGIRPADQTKIFEPFYTTKEKGVGIGLFIVKQVLEKDFGGSLTVASNKTQGTTFTISLPKSYYARKSRS
ncbi:MAG TPA: HAMP domain-containing sensor histidine kinase [Candidatus Saccharimonadales bacterium]|nr:HAMP domain-containing sensor histidine kinase [Candidatus Saccharimonadales bacterium]